MMYLCSNVSTVYDEIALGIPTGNFCSNIKPYAVEKLTGYVHNLRTRNAILITDNCIPYLITAEMTQEYALATGDKIYADVTYSTTYERHIVSKIHDIEKSTYDNSEMVRSTRDFIINNTKLKLGNTILYNINEATNIHDAVDKIFEFVPLGTQKFVLSFDGRIENFDTSYKLFTTKITLSNRDKLTVCLMAFFEAKELASKGKDVVLVIDSLDKMFYIYNSCMQKPTYIDPLFISSHALSDYESILRCSGCLKDKGTLTIVGLHKQGITAPQKYITERLYQIFDVII